MNELLKNICEQPEELQKVLAHLTKDPQVNHIANELNAAKKIVLTSMGSAYYSLQPMYYALDRNGKNVRLIETSELLQNPDRISKDSLYVLMSRSGESYEVAALPAMLTEMGIRSIGITMSPESTMAKNCSIVLYDPCSYDAMVCTKAYTSMALCGLICATYAERGCIPQTLFEELNRMFTWMNQSKEQILAQFEALDYLGDTPSFYFLSRGYGMGVIQSASLWLEEESKKCSGVLSLDGFYHGPVEVVSATTLPLYLDVCENDRAEVIWKDICSFARHSIYLGPVGKAPSNCDVINYPHFDVDEEYRMLLLAMYFQFFAYQSAKAAGVTPGEFRVLHGWVVK